MTIFFILVFLVYSVLLLVLTWGWLLLGVHRTLKQVRPDDRFISVVIAFRNEENTIPSMLKDLDHQAYGKESFEIILVDDHSSDQSTALIAKENYPNLTSLTLPEGKTGKKAALDFGIHHAKGQIITVTDMDCRLPSAWLTKINYGFQSDSIKMMVGAVRIDPSQSLFSKMQSLEFSSLVGTSGATLGFGQPTMCNGANLSFLKSAYEQVYGYEGNETIPSGDDEFLMRKIAARWKDSVRFLYDQHTIVSTAAQPSWNAFFNQRLRWASKWKYNSSAITQSVAITVLIFHAYFLLSFVFVAMGKIDLTDALMVWSVKMICEAVFLSRVGWFLGLRWSWTSFFSLQFTHSLYVVGVGILSQVRGYNWKGRRWNPLKAAPIH